MTLSQRPALICGGSRGIGLATATWLRGVGRDVLIHGRGMRPELEATAASIGAVACAFDVRNPDSVAEGIREVCTSYGIPSSVVYSVGVNIPVSLEEASEEDIEEIFQVNFFGAVRVARALLPRMLDAGGGSVVLVTSIRGTDSLASERVPFYSASKAALGNLAVTMAKSYSPTIRVNAVAPGFTRTDMSKTWSEGVSQQARGNLVGRPAEPNEIGALIGFLLSDSAGYITGQCVIIDGGYATAKK